MKPTFSIELRIKAISLADEIRTIHRWEGRLKKALRAVTGDRAEAIQADLNKLINHRILVVEYEARSTNLAKGFLKGWPYSRIEAKRYSNPSWDSIQRMAEKYGSGTKQEIAQTFEQWKQAAGEPLDRNKVVRPPRDTSQPKTAPVASPEAPRENRKKFLGIF